MKKTILKTILPMLVASLITGAVVYGATVYTDTTPDSDETVKIIEKEYDVPATTATVEINMGKTIDFITEKKKDIEAILMMMNGPNGVAGFNDGLTGLESATKPLSDATCSFPTIPKKIIDVEIIK